MSSLAEYLTANNPAVNAPILEPTKQSIFSRTCFSSRTCTAPEYAIPRFPPPEKIKQRSDRRYRRDSQKLRFEYARKSR